MAGIRRRTRIPPAVEADRRETAGLKGRAKMIPMLRMMKLRAVKREMPVYLAMP
jgi:hypothetical protein